MYTNALKVSWVVYGRGPLRKGFKFSFSDSFLIDITEDSGKVNLEVLVVIKETSSFVAGYIYKVFVKAIFDLRVSYSPYIADNKHDFLFIRWKLGLVLVYIKVGLSNKGLKLSSLFFKYF